MEIEKFRTIVLPLREKLLAMARKMLPNDNDAEDAVQETMIRIWQAKSKLIIHPNLGGYAMQTLKNICIDKIKEEKHNISLDNLQIDSNTISPHRHLENCNDVDIVKQIIEKLPELQKLIITMRDVEEYELEDIATITGSNVAAVKVNLSRARKKVRDIFLNIQSIKTNTYG